MITTYYLTPPPMENAMLIAMIAGPIYVVLGLSILFYAKAWGKLMDKWTKDHFTLVPLMFTHLVFGLMIINMYNVWVWDQWILVTLTGWGMFLEGAAYFLLPGSVFKDMAKTFNKSGFMYFGGLVSIVFGGVLSYYAYMV